MWDEVAGVVAASGCDRANVWMQSWVRPNEVPDTLRASHIGVLPMTTDSLWQRSKSPTKLFEYMASGLAVVCSNSGEPRHVVKHGTNGYLVNSKDEWVDALVELIEE